MYGTDPHYFKGDDGEYYVVKKSLAGVYEVFHINDKVEQQLLKEDEEFRRFIKEYKQ